MLKNKNTYTISFPETGNRTAAVKLCLCTLSYFFFILNSDVQRLVDGKCCIGAALKCQSYLWGTLRSCFVGESTLLCCHIWDQTATEIDD